MKIVIDAGHGYQTPGKRSPDGMREYEFNRVVANYSKKMLEDYEEVEVFFTHSDDRDVPLKERTIRANQLNADIFVSIHANALGAGGWNNGNGIGTFVYISKPSEACDVAKVIQNRLVDMTGRKNRGVKTADFQVLRDTKMSSILCECGFMTDRKEAALLKTDLYRKTCAEAIVIGLVDYYKLTLKTEKIVKGKWKVQVGAFTSKENADKLGIELIQKGYKVFIVYED